MWSSRSGVRGRGRIVVSAMVKNSPSWAKKLARPGLAQDLQRLQEAAPRLAHRDAEAVELALAGAAAEADRELAPLQHVVEHRDLLADRDRVVPGQHDDHGAEVDALGHAGEVGQILHRAAGHDVGREVVVDRPQRVVAHRFDEAAQVQILLVDLGVP